MRIFSMHSSLFFLQIRLTKGENHVYGGGVGWNIKKF